jgi:hypothetical protein
MGRIKYPLRLRVIRGYERRVRQLALKSDYRVARTLPR